MRTWRRVVILLMLGATAFLAYRWWQGAASRAERRPHGAGDPAQSEPRSASGGGPATAGSPEVDRQDDEARRGPKLDRQKADRMRQEIRALLAEAGPLPWVSGPGSSAPGPSAAAFRTMPLIAEDDAGGTKVDPQYLRDVMRRDFFPLAKSCYTGALEKNPRLGGRVELHFRILGDRKVGGVVDEAKLLEGTTIDDPEFQTCVRESMMSVSFDAPPEDGALSVTFPIVFSPEDDD